MNEILEFIKNPWHILSSFVYHTAKYWPDKLFLKIRFRACVGYCLNLESPQTYNEKLQWLKLYSRHPEYKDLVDKAVVKDWVAEKIGKEYVIPTLGIWDSVESIDWNSLPNCFVIKCTGDSGGGDYL